MESLFSFGLYVEHICGLHKSCTNPAVGFRFLDYPTVVIYGQSTSEAKVLEDDENDNIDGDNTPDDPDLKRKCYFKKGKSCLFKNDTKELCKLLNEIPLYIMVFDSTDQSSQLKGCCSIPLISLFSQVENKMKALGHDSPATAEEVGVFAVYNLMGTKTGEIKLQLKLNFYGTSLSKHTHCNDINSVDTYLNLNLNKPLCNCIKPEQLVDRAVPHHDMLQLDHKPKKLTEHKGVQCNDKNYVKQHKKRENKKKYNSEQVDEFHNTNICCPPPLFLNLYESTARQFEQPSSPLQSELFYSHKLRDKYGSPDSILSLEEPYKEILQPVNNRNSVHIVSDKVEGKEDSSKNKQPGVNKDPPHKKLSFHENLSNIDLPQDENIINISKLPLLSALSAEILKLAKFIDKQEPSERRAEVLYGDGEQLQKEIEPIYKLSEKVLDKPVDEIDVNNRKNKKEKVIRPDNGKSKSKNMQAQKEKLRFKTTRTQKLRYKYNMKQIAPTCKKTENLYQSKEQDDDDLHTMITSNVKVSNVKETDDLKLDSLERVNTKVGDWMSTLQPQEKEPAKSDDIPLQSSDIVQHVNASEKYAPSTSVVCESKTAATSGPGFYTPASTTENPPSKHDISGHNRNSSTLKKEHRSSRSRSRSAMSRNLESSMYAYDTFSSEDPEDISKGHNIDTRSSSVISQTSSISLPLSGKDSDKSSSQMSKDSGKSSRYSNELGRPRTHRSTQLLRQHSVKSDKSRHRYESVGNRSDNSLSEHPNVSYKSTKTSCQHSVNSNRSEISTKPVSHSPDKQYTVVSDKHKSSSQHSSVSNKPDISPQQQQDAPEEGNQQMYTSNSFERVNSSNLSSVKLQRYMGDMSSASLKGSSEKHTMDMLDDSRPATQASVNTLPEDSIFSPTRISSADPENEAKNIEIFSSPSPIKRSVSPGDGILSPLVNTPTGSLSPDKMSGVRPNSSVYSPRKSKHTAPSFQISKRAHGMGKLEERPVSELSGDTTLREIDMFIGEDSQLTSGSSVVMTTDESFSPIASANIPRKYKHGQGHVHGINKFDNRQVETVKEVDVSADEEEEGMLTIKKSVHGDIGVPTQSDFSPHQSKQFVQKKKYDNVFRETLPPFSSNTNESSNDAVL